MSQGSDFYLLSPTSFLQNMRVGLRNWGVLARNMHTEIFGSLEGITPGMAQVVHALLTYNKGRPDLALGSLICAQPDHRRLGSEIRELASTFGRSV